MTVSTIGALFHPKSVAVVGASETSRGRAILTNLRRLRYHQAVYAVNPQHETIFGQPCYPDLKSIPGRIDAVAAAVGKERVARVVGEAADLGVAATVAFAGGFAEQNATGKREQEELAKRATAAGMALCGPNTLGVWSPMGQAAMFLEELNPRPAGNIAAVCQSGWAALAIANSVEFAPNCVVATGNQGQLNSVDYMGYLLDEPSTVAILAYIEEIGDEGRFLEMAARARAVRKPIVLLKSGRSARSMQAARIHTGADSSVSPEFLKAAREQRVILIQSLDEMVAVGSLFAKLGARPARGSGVAFITNSGGQVSVLLDQNEEFGVSLAEFGSTTTEVVAKALGEVPKIPNPLDLDNLPLESYRECLFAFSRSPTVDLVAICLPARWHRRVSELIDMAGEAMARYDKPVLILASTSTADGLDPRSRAESDVRRLPVLVANATGLRAISHYLWYGRDLVDKD